MDRKSIIAVIASCVLTIQSSAQMTRVQELGMKAEADIFVDTNGVRYSNLVRLHFNASLISAARGQKEIDLSQIGSPSSGAQQLLRSLRKRYGPFAIEKTRPDKMWGENYVTNKRTGKTLRGPDFSQSVRLIFANLVPTDSVCGELRSYSFVDWVEPPLKFYVTTSPNDPHYVNGDQWGLAAVQASNAWNITKGASSTKIAIHDLFDRSGQKDTIIELASKLTGGRDLWWGHGTLVSSVAGGVTNNNYGIASLGWLPELWPFDMYILDDISAAADAGADVINMSWVTLYDDAGLRNNIIYALLSGTVCVSGISNNIYQPVPLMNWPAAYKFEGDTGRVITVNATTLVSGVERFIEKNYNYSVANNPVGTYTEMRQSFVDLCAPGANILVAFPDGSFSPVEGTSVSIPLVSALVADMLSVNQSLTVNDIFNILIATADKIDSNYSYDVTGENGNSWNRRLGYGRINAYKALQYLITHYGGTLTQSLTIPSGETWTFSPGITIRVPQNMNITVNGTLLAVGTSSNRITFTSSSATWNGIAVNSGGSATIKYCNISNVSTGIYLNNASATIDHNTITSTNGGGIGIYGYGGGYTKVLTYNVISAFTTIYSDYYNTLYLLNPTYGTSGHNETMPGSASLVADYNSNIEAGGYSGIQGQNSFYGGGIDAQAIAQDNSTIIAQYNWWNYDFSYIEYDGGVVDMSNPLGSDPNGGFGASAAPTRLASLSGSSTGSSPLNILLFDAALDSARQKMAEGDFEEAIRLFSEKYKSDTDVGRRRYALARLAECYKLAERTDFIDFLNSTVRPAVDTKDDLYLETLELQGNSLVGAGKYPEAASVFEGIKTDYSGKPETYKHALFNLANLHYSQLGDKAKAEQYVEELKAKYPNDRLTSLARILLGEEVVPMPAQGAAKNVGEPLPWDISLNNYPNPFNPVTNIRFTIPEPSFVTLKAYDLLGREVAVLVNEEKQPGIYVIPFDASHLPSGVYFYRLTAGAKSIIKRMAVVK